MIHERVYLYENNDKVYLDTYVTNTELDRPRRAILVFPGGGYGFCWWGEGEPVARQFMTSNFCAFVLNYSTKPDTLRPDGTPSPLIDASKAMAYIKRNAGKFRIDPDKIAVIGFSAGSHLAGTLGTMWHYDFVREAAQIEYGENRPGAMILSYPVLSSDPEIAHKGSFNNLLTGGTGEAPQDKMDFYSVEKQVSDKTCPTFMWHTAPDGVKVENTLAMAIALSEHKIPFEVHVFPEGPHGLSIATREIKPDDGEYLEYVGRWVDYAKAWLDVVMP